MGAVSATAPLVLVVDDEPAIAALVRGYLERDGLRALIATDGPAALAAVAAHRPAVVLLDVGLPGLDGTAVCRRMRDAGDWTPVLFVTARDDEVDRVLGLELGADDYVTKPFSPRELVARVKAMLRRPRTLGTPPTEPDVPVPLLVGDLVVDLARHEVRRRDEPIHLTPREFDLLAVLAAHPGMVFTRNQLLHRIWGDEYFDTRVVDVHIASLRKKLDDDPAHPRYIETVRGVGYRSGERRAGPAARDRQG